MGESHGSVTGGGDSFSIPTGVCGRASNLLISCRLTDSLIGEHVYNMKAIVFAWIALASVVFGQQSEEERKYYEEFARSEQRAISEFPDAAKPDSALAKEMAKIDKALKNGADPIFYSANKPYIIAQRAAKSISESQAASPVQDKPKASSILSSSSETIPEIGGFKSVVVRKIEPDGISVVHDCGAGKIPIEKLTAAERAKFGISMEGASEFRRQVAENTAAYYARQRELEAQAEAEAKAAAQAAGEAEMARQQETQENPPIIVQAPVWERLVTNSVARANNRNKVVDEIRRQDGDSAAEQYLAEQRLADMESSQSDGDPVAAIPSRNRISYLEGGKYQKRGNVIAVGGNFGSGYTISGDSLTKDGSVTHKRSGSMWMPVKQGEKQIYDP